MLHFLSELVSHVDNTLILIHYMFINSVYTQAGNIITKKESFCNADIN